MFAVHGTCFNRWMAHKKSHQSQKTIMRLIISCTNCCFVNKITSAQQDSPKDCTPSPCMMLFRKNFVSWSRVWWRKQFLAVFLLHRLQVTRRCFTACSDCPAVCIIMPKCIHIRHNFVSSRNDGCLMQICWNTCCQLHVLWCWHKLG